MFNYICMPFLFIETHTHVFYLFVSRQKLVLILASYMEDGQGQSMTIENGGIFLVFWETERKES